MMARERVKELVDLTNTYGQICFLSGIICLLIVTVVTQTLNIVPTLIITIIISVLATYFMIKTNAEYTEKIAMLKLKESEAKKR